MSKYFEIVYPQRMKELKEKLDIIANRFDKIPNDKDHIEEQVTLVKEFHNEFRKFVDNTSLHLKSEGVKNQITDESEIKFVTKEYFLEYFGKDTLTGELFEIIQTMLKTKNNAKQ